MFQIKTYDEVLNDYKSFLLSYIPQANVSDNSFFMLIGKVISYVIAGLYSAIAVVYKDALIQTATGEQLDALGENYGITRKEAVVSTGYLLFTGTNGSSISNVKAQNSAGINEDVLEFITVETKTIESKTSTGISFTASHTITGTGFNFVVGDVIYITGSTSNNGIFTVNTASSTSLVVDETIATESAGASVTIARLIKANSFVGGEKYNV